jgi:hypothetical protein
MGRGKKYPPLDLETQARLRERFRPQVEDLEALLHRDLSAWKPPNPVAPPLAEAQGQDQPPAPDAPNRSRNAG